MKTFATNKHHLIDLITPNRWMSWVCWWAFPNLASADKCGSPSPIWRVKIEWDIMQIKMRGSYWTQQNGLFLNGSILSGRLQLGLTILFNVLRRGRWVLGINFKTICNWGKLIENRLGLVQASDYIHFVVDEMKCKRVWWFQLIFVM